MYAVIRRYSNQGASWPAHPPSAHARRGCARARTPNQFRFRSPAVPASAATLKRGPPGTYEPADQPKDYESD
jgi:hypothetical protein